MPLLSLKDVYAGYADGPDVLKGVSLSLENGECVAIVGVNGSGKSTLLRVIAGLCKPRKGIVTYTGKSNPAFLLQNPKQQMLCGTVREEIEYSLVMNYPDEPDLDGRVHAQLMRFGLQDRADLPPASLSGGQQQKLALAALLCREPELLLLDEPDSFLDGRSRSEFRSFLFSNFRAGIVWIVSRINELPPNARGLRLQSGTLVEV